MSDAKRDMRHEPLKAAVTSALAAVAKFNGAARLINDLDLQKAIAPVGTTALLVFKLHQPDPLPTIADDAAAFLTAFGDLPIPEEDEALGALPGLDAVNGARGLVLDRLNRVRLAAQALGLRESEPALPDIGSTDAPQHGLEGMLRLLTARMTAVEHLLDSVVTPEGAVGEGRTKIQIALVNIFVKNMHVELALGKFAARLKASIDLSTLARAVENAAELTADFVATVRGVAEKMTQSLRLAAERLRPAVRKIVGLFNFGLRKAKRLLARDKLKPSSPPPDFDLAAVHAMILDGRAPKADWRPGITELDFTGKKFLKGLGPLAQLGALVKLDLDQTNAADLAPVAGLTALQMLRLNGTQVADLAPVAGLAALLGLSLNDTQVADLAPVAGLTALRRLYLDNTKVADLAPVAGLTELEAIHVESAARKAALAKTWARGGKILKVSR